MSKGQVASSWASQGERRNLRRLDVHTLTGNHGPLLPGTLRQHTCHLSRHRPHCQPVEGTEPTPYSSSANTSISSKGTKGIGPPSQEPFADHTLLEMWGPRPTCQATVPGS